MPNIRGPELLILVLVIVLLFGAKRLPDAARSVGRSLRIFKSETKGLVDGEESSEESTASTAEAPAPAPAPLPPAAPAQQAAPPAPIDAAAPPVAPGTGSSSVAPNADEARSALQQPPSQA